MGYIREEGIALEIRTEVSKQVFKFDIDNKTRKSQKFENLKNALIGEYA